MPQPDSLKKKKTQLKTFTIKVPIKQFTASLRKKKVGVCEIKVTKRETKFLVSPGELTAAGKL